mgnify:CR=1 FL=1
MKLTKLLFCSFLFISHTTFSQFEYAESKENPYGKYNPKAPKQVKDYEGLIGECDCLSERRNPDRTWAKPVKMKWKWKYIMNGNGVQDLTLKEDGSHGGSIRQFNKDSLKWYVHYYTNVTATPKLGAWSGNKNKNGEIVLYKPQNAPNGTEGFSRLTFYDINKKGYKWKGEWVDKTESIVFPFWRITCTRKD